MTHDPTRRFTDREVALVLRKAAEIDEAEGSEPRGLSLEDLRQIAREVGLSPAAVDRAVAALERRPERGPLRGAPSVRRAAHAVVGELDEGAVARLVQMVDERASAAGSVTQALGSVRWTSTDKIRSQQVSITPANGETAIQVVERAAPGLPFVLHLVPGIWGWVGATAVAGGIGVTGGALLAAMGGGVVLGAATGRALWYWMSARSGRRVERLAADLAREAHEAARPGTVGA